MYKHSFKAAIMAAVASGWDFPFIFLLLLEMYDAPVPAFNFNLKYTKTNSLWWSHK